MVTRGKLFGIACFLLLVGVCGPGESCTDIFLTSGGHMVSARTMDLSHIESKVVINPRGIARKSIHLRPGDVAVEWVSKYGSVIVNAFDPSIPLAE